MKLFNVKGMTLIELIIAFALLSIISVFTLGIFSTNYINIFNTGKRSQTLMVGNSIADKIYKRSVSGVYNNTTDVQSMVDDVLSTEGYTPDDFKCASSLDTLYTPENKEYIRYFVEPETSYSGVNGFPFKLVVFYDNNKQNISLTSFIIEGGI